MATLNPNFYKQIYFKRIDTDDFIAATNYLFQRGGKKN